MLGLDNLDLGSRLLLAFIHVSLSLYVLHCYIAPLPLGTICADPEGGRGSGPPPGKSQVAICFLRNTGNDLHRETIGPKGVQLLVEGRPHGPL